MTTVSQCNKIYDEKTFHPLVSIVRADKEANRSFLFDCYSVALLEYSETSAFYGHKTCDFTDAILLFRKPSEAVNVGKGQLLLFHPSILDGTSLGCFLCHFTFFGYSSDEALHLSHRELKVVKEVFSNIRHELKWGIDKYSQTILCNLIELLLNYSQRYYCRQFITRHEEENLLMEEFQIALKKYFTDGRVFSDGLPKIDGFGRLLKLSPNYLDDLIKAHTGKDFVEFVRLQRLYLAQQQIKHTNKNFDDIAKELGFCSGDCMGSLIRKATGRTLSELRQSPILKLV